MGCGRVLLAGESAGFLNSMGEGISSGMESGYRLACAIIQGGDDEDAVYSLYQTGTAPLKTYMERQWNFAANLSTTFSHMQL